MNPITVNGTEFTHPLDAIRAFLAVLPRSHLKPLLMQDLVREEHQKRYGILPSGKPGTNVVQEKGESTTSRG